jgi:proteasome assembly chaperone (PAC2) family protein
MTRLLHWSGDVPELRRPLLLVALDGFVDAGGAAATAGMFLRHRWQSEALARFDRDALLDYRARRPTAVVDSGVLRRIEWPDLELFGAEVEGAHDAVLLLGPEPDMRWEEFAGAVADACQRLGVECVIGLGAYPAAVPHTRPTRVVRATSAEATDLLPDIPAVGGYTGPVGAGTVVQAALAERGYPVVGLWAEVPHYIAASPNPMAALALVRLVAGVFEAAVDTTELEAAAKLHVEQVDEAVAQHPEAVEMVRVLEGFVDAGEPEERLPSGEDLAVEIERFLRSQPPGAGT